MDLQEWERTADMSTAQFIEFMKFLADNDLLDKALKTCEEQDLGQIRVSVQHIRAVQEMIKDSALPPSAKESSVIASAHVDGMC